MMQFAGTLFLSLTFYPSTLDAQTAAADASSSQASVWVSDGCSAEFATGAVADAKPTTPKAPSHIPNAGFLLVDDEGLHECTLLNRSLGYHCAVSVFSWSGPPGCSVRCAW